MAQEACWVPSLRPCWLRYSRYVGERAVSWNTVSEKEDFLLLVHSLLPSHKDLLHNTAVLGKEGNRFTPQLCSVTKPCSRHYGRICDTGTVLRSAARPALPAGHNCPALAPRFVSIVRLIVKDRDNVKTSVSTTSFITTL